MPAKSSNVFAKIGRGKIGAPAFMHGAMLGLIPKGGKPGFGLCLPAFSAFRPDNKRCKYYKTRNRHVFDTVSPRVGSGFYVSSREAFALRSLKPCFFSVLLPKIDLQLRILLPPVRVVGIQSRT
jgi:hypothetical protein